MIIAIDFDGTCVTHEFPKVGRDIGAEEVLKALVKKGHRLILFTMRSDNQSGPYLTEAINWFKKRGIPLWGIQTNPTQKKWTSSPKAHAELYIDDRGLGIPLIENNRDEPYVNWVQVQKMLVEKGIL